MKFRAAALLTLLLLAACSDEDTGISDIPAEAVVRLAPGGDPVPGIKVVAMDPDTNLPAAAPEVSDEDGRCVFSDLAAGQYALVPFGGAEYYVIGNREILDAWGKSNAGESASLTDPDKTSPAPPPAAILMGLRTTPGDLPRISGMVVDAVTGDPLETAFVTTSPFLTGYGGGTTYKDDVTLADGRFTVYEILFAQDPVTGNLVQVESLLVTCAGYRPLSWRHQMGNGDNNLDITGVTIPLEPVQAGDTGRLSGRLLLAGEPAAGVRVGLGGLAGDKSAVGQPGYVAVTDTEGIFRFTGLPDGVYFLHPGFLQGDGYAFPDQPANIGRTVQAGEETLAGDLVLLRETRLVYPPSGWEYFGPEWIGGLRWETVPGAANYEVFLDRGVVGQTDTTVIDLPEDWVPNSGPHSWYVLAYDGQDQIVGTTETSGIFFIVDPPTD